jgi:hypothetical protein
VTEAERAVLGSMMLSPRAAAEVAQILSAADFSVPRHELIFVAAAWLHSQGDPCDVIAVADELLGNGELERAGGADFLHGLTSEVTTPANAGYYAHIVREESVRRRLREIGFRLQEPSGSDALAAAITELTALRDSSVAGGDQDGVRTLADLLSVPESEDAYDWVIPGVLERGDRLMLSAGEGVGKSTFLRQMGVLSAAGLHPFEFHQIPPIRVLIVDAENTERQWRRSSRDLVARAEQFGARAPGAFAAVHCVSTMDLSRSADLGRIHRWMDLSKPDLVVLGPLYRMTSGSLNDEEAVEPVLRALESIRARNVAMMIEVHAGHTRGAGGERELRPRGSSALLGWPEFGLGIRKDPIAGPRRTFSLVRWRGDRDARDWPERFVRGMSWPWEPTV